MIARRGRPASNPLQCPVCHLSPIICHSEERSDEESREQDNQRDHTGSFTSFRMTAYFWSSECWTQAKTERSGRPHRAAPTDPFWVVPCRGRRPRRPVLNAVGSWESTSSSASPHPALRATFHSRGRLRREQAPALQASQSIAVGALHEAPVCWKRWEAEKAGNLKHLCRGDPCGRPCWTWEEAGRSGRPQGSPLQTSRNKAAGAALRGGPCWTRSEDGGAPPHPPRLIRPCGPPSPQGEGFGGSKPPPYKRPKALP